MHLKYGEMESRTHFLRGGCCGTIDNQKLVYTHSVIMGYLTYTHSIIMGYLNQISWDILWIYIYIYLGYLTDMILAVQKWSLPHDDHTEGMWGSGLSYCGWKKKSCNTNRMVETPINIMGFCPSIWVNYKELTTSSLEIIVRIRGIIPKWPNYSG